MMIKEKHVLVLSLLLGVPISLPAQKVDLVSPNKNIKIELGIENLTSGYGEACFNVKYIHKEKSLPLFSSIKLGLQTDQRNWFQNLKLRTVSSQRHVVSDYRMLTGKRSHCQNQGTEQTFTFENKEGQTLDVILRAYNDGVAFKYHLKALKGENITAEFTTYPLTKGTKRWMQQYDPGYEGFYPEIIEGKSGKWGYPALVEPHDSLFALITEANILRDHCASWLDNQLIAEQYRIQPANSKLPISGSWESPWRVLIIGSLANIVESTLVTDLSEPSRIIDSSWIIPGNVAWIYWASNNGSNDFQQVKDYIDLASKMGWPYDLIDWKWDVMTNGGNVEDAIKYALQKKVKPMLWYNSGTSWVGVGAPGPLDHLNSKARREKEFTWLNKIGVVGIKVDFFAGDKVDMMNYYLDLLEDAARFKLMLVFHGATIPRGWQRTYPNMMTVEGVYGAEWYNNAPMLTNKAAVHNTTLPFTRNVVGPMDYTPGTFSDSQHPHITTHGHELALMVVFESALQHRPDRPSVYYAMPEPVKKLLSILPTAWDDTKLLSGYPGKNIVIARRKGNIWYVAGLNGTDQPLTLDFVPGNLTGAAKTMTIFEDGVQKHSFTIRENVPIKDKQTAIQIACKSRGGFVALIE